MPGVSSIIVENKTGAGTLVAANHVYNVAKPDGLTIGMVHGNLILQEVLGGQGIEFDSRKFNWVIVPNINHYVCALSKASGVNNAEEWLASKRPMKMGATAPGDSTSDVPRILRAAFGLPVKVVEGHKGTPPIRLGVTRGELDGVCMSWESISLKWPDALKKGKIRIIVQAVHERHPDLKNVPLASDLAKSEEGRQLIDVAIASMGKIGRLFVLPPKTPQDRVETLRTAFNATLKDPEFLAEMKKTRLPVEPVSGEEVKKLINKLHNMSPALLKKMKALLLPKG